MSVCKTVRGPRASNFLFNKFCVGVTFNESRLIIPLKYATISTVLYAFPCNFWAGYVAFEKYNINAKILRVMSTEKFLKAQRLKNEFILNSILEMGE